MSTPPRRSPADAAPGEETAHFTQRVYEEDRGGRPAYWALWRFLHGAELGPVAPLPGVAEFAAMVLLRLKVRRCAAFLEERPALSDWETRCGAMEGWATDCQAQFAALVMRLECTPAELWGLVGAAERGDTT